MADSSCSGKIDPNVTGEDKVITTSDESNEPLVIHPEKELNSDSDNELEFCDALENTDKTGIRDELSDIKSKRTINEDRKIDNEYNRDALDDGDDDLYKDAEDDDDSDHKLNEAESRDRKSEELQRRKEAEDRLSEETKQVYKFTLVFSNISCCTP